MVSSRDCLVLFTRYPQPGKCKTRLIPVLGQETATSTHKQLVTHTMETVREFAKLNADTTYHIYYDGASASQMKQWLGSCSFIEQQGKNIGERMANALLNSLKEHQNCVLIGSDCPDITSTLLQDAFLALQTNDLVLGPAFDGGYYLVGVSGSNNPDSIRNLFQKIPWGSDKVLHTTIQRARDLKFQFHLLQKLHDIDIPDDLKYFHHRPHSQ